MYQIPAGTAGYSQSRSGLDLKFRSRSIRIGFSIGITIAIVISKSLIDFKIKNGDRFSYENRDPIFRSAGISGPETVFQLRIDFNR
jgi:hypothetical protein